VVSVIILRVFGAGKAPRVMGDLAKGNQTFEASPRAAEGRAGGPSVSATADDRSPPRSR
jgi:hypothetical protein